MSWEEDRGCFLRKQLLNRPLLMSRGSLGSHILLFSQLHVQAAIIRKKPMAILGDWAGSDRSSRGGSWDMGRFCPLCSGPCSVLQLGYCHPFLDEIMDGWEAQKGSYG